MAIFAPDERLPSSATLALSEGAEGGEVAEGADGTDVAARYILSYG